MDFKHEEKTRIALVISHPIQHFCPQYASFASHPLVELKVFFASSLGHQSYFDPNFRQTISWNNLRLDQFAHEFLNDGKVLQPDSNLDAPGIEEALEKFNPQAVIIYGYFQKLQRRVHKWARSAGVRLVYIADTELRQKRNKLKEMVKYPLIRKFFSGIDYVLTVGDANEAYYKYAGIKKEQMVRMHFPIDIELYEQAFSQKAALRAALRQKLNIGEDEFVAVVTGKLVPWKNQDHIIDAMIALEEKQLPMHLLVAGSGETESLLQQKAAQLTKSKVHFAGFVTPDELPAFYAAADTYIHPASVEPHSLAISEAIYMGCPAIISDRCGSWGDSDDVQPGRNGFVYAFGDINELCACIMQMINDPQQRLRFGAVSHELGVMHQHKAHRLVLDDLLSRINYGIRTEKVNI